MSQSAGSPPMGGHSRTEYGVIVDNTEVGRGYRLAEVCRNLDVAESSATHYRELEERPVEVKVRRVFVTDWQPINRT